MTLLENHLEQISLSARSIADLQFLPPKIFTNALLGNNEITTLIRDTEPHERALFSLDPSAVNGATARTSRRHTAFSTKEAITFARKKAHAGPEARKQSAVARVLGTDMLQDIQESSGPRSRAGIGGRVNVEVLLRGAEKLCAVYPVQGAPEKIASLRNRHRQIADSIQQYEERVSKQQLKLDRMNKGSEHAYDFNHRGEDVELNTTGIEPTYTDFDMHAEEEEIRELEAKKKALENRVAGIEKDLGGLRT